jgi:hypothetical protein
MRYAAFMKLSLTIPVNFHTSLARLANAELCWSRTVRFLTSEPRGTSAQLTFDLLSPRNEEAERAINMRVRPDFNQAIAGPRLVPQAGPRGSSKDRR